MKKRNLSGKCLSALIAVMLLAGTLNCSWLLNEYGEVYAADPETAVLFETDFENYTSGAELDPSGAVVLRNANMYELAQDEDGNKGMKVSRGTPQLDYTLPQAMTSGRLYVTFDIEVGTEMDSENTGVVSYFSIYGDEFDTDGEPVAEANRRKYVFYIRPAAGFVGPRNNLIGWGDLENNPLAYSANTRYNIQMVCDLTNKHYYTYINGELLSDVAFSGATYFNEISKLNFVFYPDIVFFDNLKISYMTDSSFDVNAKFMDSSTVAVDFTEGVAYTEEAEGKWQPLLEEDSFRLIDPMDGTVIPIQNIEFISPRRALITVDEMTEGRRLNLTVSDITNAYGTALPETGLDLLVPYEISTNVFYYENFEDYNNDIIGNGSDYAWNSMHVTNAADGSFPIFESNAAYDGGKALKIPVNIIPNSGSSVYRIYDYFNDKKIYMDGMIDFEMKFKHTDQVSQLMTVLHPGQGFSSRVFYTSATAICYNSLTTAQSGTWQKLADFTSDNWYTLRAAYDFNREQTTVYINENEPVSGLLINNFDTIKEEKYFSFLELMFTPSAVQNNDISPEAWVDYIKITHTIRNPGVDNITAVCEDGTEDDLYEAVPSAIKKIKLYLGGNIDPASVGNISLKQGETSVDCTGTYDEKERIYTLALAEGTSLRPDTSYTLDLSSVKDTYGHSIALVQQNFVTAEVPLIESFSLVDENGEAVTKSELQAGDKVRCELVLNDDGKTEKVVLLGGVYSDGLLIESQMADAYVSAENGTTSIELTVPEGEYEIKGFCWEDWTTIKPLTKEICLE